jgi:hypothetical protein
MANRGWLATVRGSFAECFHAAWLNFRDGLNAAAHCFTWFGEEDTGTVLLRFRLPSTTVTSERARVATVTSGGARGLARNPLNQDEGVDKVVATGA